MPFEYSSLEKKNIHSNHKALRNVKCFSTQYFSLWSVNFKVIVITIFSKLIIKTRIFQYAFFVYYTRQDIVIFITDFFFQGVLWPYYNKSKRKVTLAVMMEIMKISKMKVKKKFSLRKIVKQKVSQKLSRTYTKKIYGWSFIQMAKKNQVDRPCQNLFMMKFNSFQ